MFYKYLIIAGIIIVGIYILFLSRNYIVWFIKEIKYKLKYTKEIEKIKRNNINERSINLQQIKKYIIISKKHLKELNLEENKEFKLSKDLERHLIYSKFSEKYLKELLFEIAKHMNITAENIKLNINYISTKNNSIYAGLYKENKEIILNIRNNMEISTVVATLVHECTHYLLISNGIILEDRESNEYLTDITAVLLGFEKYMLEGYKTSNKLVYKDVYKRSIKQYKVGYLTYKDIKVVIREKNKK